MAKMLLDRPLREVSQEVKVIPWQLTAATDIIRGITMPVTMNNGYVFPNGKFGAMLRGGTGIGKMFIACHAIRQMTENKQVVMPVGSNCPFPFVWVIPSNAMIQTNRVLKLFGIQHLVHVMSYGTWRKNNPYIEWKKINTNDDKDVVPEWRDEWLPAVVILDECQNLRNPQTSTTQVAMALAVKTHAKNVKVIFSSATPYQRLCESRAAMVCMGVLTKYNNLPLTNDVFPSWASSVAACGKSMYDYSPKSMQNLREACDAWYVEPKGIKFPFPAKTILSEVDISPEKRERYNAAYQEYLRELWEKKRRTGPAGIMAQWVALGKFQEKAELLREDILAKRAVTQVDKGHQVIIGSKYRNTLRAVYLTLTKKLGFPANQISFIVGGQKPESRQLNIDCFQEGASKIMLLMMKAGGVAISLHHDRDSKFSLPRYVILPPTYAAPELVQVLGRGHRITSRSKTTQEVIWIKDTVESEKVLPKVRTKLRCLDAAVVAKEQWGHMLEDGDSEEEFSESYQQNEENERKNNRGGSNEEEEQEEGEQIDAITGEGLSNED